MAQKGQVYYKIPLKFGSLFQRHTLPKASLEESLAGVIHLVLITSFEEYDYDETYGCEIWEMDFELILNPSSWLKQFSSHLSRTLEKNEGRLKNFKARCELEQIEVPGGVVEDSVMMKRMLSVEIHANLVTTNEVFYYKDRILISPFSPE